MNITTKFLLTTCSLVLLTACGSRAVSDNANADSVVVSTQIGVQDDFAQKTGDKVYFAFDRSDLSYEAQDILQKQAEFLRDNPELNITIEGHCDARGTREYNMGLGERRANSAKRYLQQQGVNSGRMEVVSYGKERPAVEGDTEEAYSQNRRAVTVVK